MYDPDDLSSAIRQAGESVEPPLFDPRTAVKGGRRKLAWRGAALATSAAAISLLVLPLPGVDMKSWLQDRQTGAAQHQSVQLQDWSPLPDAPLEPRHDHVALSTGGALIIWGGLGGNKELTDGAIYDAESQRWQRLPQSPLEVSGGRTGVWTGTEMILWGGEFGGGGHAAPDTGAAYNLATRTWRRLPPSPYWSLAGHSAVWTGAEMIVWGGVSTGDPVGAAFDPGAKRWRSLPDAPIDGRHGHITVWTGEEMIVWGGNGQMGGSFSDGASFNPESNTWTKLPASPLSPVGAPVVAWTGEEMVVVGGLGASEASRLGAAYDPEKQQWRVIEASPVPIFDLAAGTVTIGRDLVVVIAEGVFSYSAHTDSWTRIESPEEVHRRGASTVVAGDRVLVWGGTRAAGNAEPTGTGWSARYD